MLSPSITKLDITTQGMRWFRAIRVHFAQVRLVNTNHLQWCRNLTWAGGGGVCVCVCGGGGGGGQHQQPTDLTLTLRQQLSPHPPASYTSNS